MRWSLLMIIIVLMVTTLSAETISWRSDYEQALREALKEQKMLLVLLIEEECPLCIKMLSTTLKDQLYIKELNDRYVSVLITKGQKGSYPIELLYTSTYPSLFLLDSQELFSQDPLLGYIGPETFREEIDLDILSQ